AAEEERGRELVVGGAQSRGAVQELHALTLELPHSRETRFDPVERRQDVDAPDDEIVFPEPKQRGGSRGPRLLPLPGEGLDQSAIRLRRLAEDEDRPVETRKLERRRRFLDRELGLCDCHHASSAASPKAVLRAG